MPPPSVFSIFGLARPAPAAPANRYAGRTAKNARKEIVRRALSSSSRSFLEGTARASGAAKPYAPSPLGKTRRRQRR